MFGRRAGVNASARSFCRHTTSVDGVAGKVFSLIPSVVSGMVHLLVWVHALQVHSTCCFLRVDP